jgi:hypothetical protein
VAEGKPDPAAIIAAGPQGGDDDIVQRYLGVPTGYAAEPATGGPVAPRYTEADLYRPESLGTEDKARLQQMLDRSGLYQKGQKYRLGVWDESDIDAYTRLLAFANRGGYTDREALDRIGQLTPTEYDEMYGKGAWARSSGAGLKGVAGPGAKPDKADAGITNQRMSEDDLRYLADRTARKSLGRSLTPDELGRFSGAYTQMISGATAREAAATAQAEAGANVTYTGATSPEVFAEQQAQRTDPTAFEARRQVGALRAIGGMLGELGGG